MIDDLSIRLAILNPATRKRIKELMLSTGDYLVISHVKAGDNTSAAIARELGITIQNASNRLLRLYRLGYLTRQEVLQKSGGYEWKFGTIYKIGGAA